MLHRFFFSLTAALALGWVARSAHAADPASAKVDFNYDIRPIISTKCFHCHGPDEKSRKAKLRLDLRGEALKEHEDGPTIVPGSASDSALIARITSKDSDEVMPPPKEDHALTAQEVQLLKRWIDQGAEYKPHWSFVKPERAAIPGDADYDVTLADLAKTDPKRAREVTEQRSEWRQWPRNPIDHFVLARMLGQGLTPSPEADPSTLCRRLYFDLAGLPPSLDEVDTFREAASRDPQAAIESLVDQLLASPAYGERWAKMWLDLARYADSTGYGSDRFRLNIWPYRDWVINAFNRNLPYDQFTIEQLAGDLLPNATPEQITATAFHRNTMTNTEGGVQPEEYRVAAVKDRIATTGQVWMGLTVGCAQCHSHKFDPIPQTDYYRLFAVFNETEDANRGDEEPTLPLPTPEEIAKTDEVKKEISAIQAKMKGSTPEMDREERNWEAQMAHPAQWRMLTPFEVTAASGTTLAAQADGSFLAVGSDHPDTDTYTVKAHSDLHGITAFRVEVLPDDSLPARGPGRAENGNAVLSELRVTVEPPAAKPIRGRYLRVTLPNAKEGLALAEVQVFSMGENIAVRGKASQSSTDFGGAAQRAIDGNTNGNFAKGKSVSHTGRDEDPWWEVDLGAEAEVENIVIWNRTDGVEGRLANFQVELLDGDRKQSWQQTVAAPPKPSVAISPDGSRAVTLRNASADFSQDGWSAENAIDGDLKTGWAFVPETGKAHAAVFETAAPLDARDDVLALTLRQVYGWRHTIGRFRVWATTQAPAPRELPPGIWTVLAIDPGARDAKQREELASYFRPLSRAYAGLGKLLDAKRAELAAIKPVMLPVMRELPVAKQRETHLLNKGNYLTPGDKVEPGLLSAFSAFVPADTKIDRLTAARWLVSPENPLTARVAVNRFWAQLFGTGIVESEEDFGTQGALPSHPQLLDWLAVAFMSPKTPGSNGETPKLSEEAMGWDMKAMLRLIVTSATYRQASKVTPDVLERDGRNRYLSHAPRRRLDAEAVRDQALALSGLLSHKLGGPSVYPPQPDGLWKVAFNGGQNAYPTSKGEDRYRRGIYTFWRRTMPYPSMATFDAPSRESCTLRRLPTNTPLQAFVTMNDPVFVECAQALGRRIVREGGNDTESRMRYALQLCLCRPPEEAQVKALTGLYKDELATYRADPEGALKLATQPLGPLPAGADAAEMAAWMVVANVLLNLDAVLTKS
jgi:hypothetical protein